MSRIKYTDMVKCEIYRNAAENMQIQVFLYDPNLEKLCFINNSLHLFGFSETDEYKVADITASGIIDPDNTEQFTRLFSQIKEEDDQVDAFIKMNLDSKTVWSYIVLSKNHIEGSDTIKIVGSIQDVSKRMETELRYSNERQYRMAMLAGSRRVYEINVTRDRFIKLEAIQDTTDYGNWNVYTKTMSKICREQIYKEDWEDFLRVATRENLLQGYKKGITEFYCEYRNIDNNGNLSWSSSETNLLKDPITGDIKGFIYSKDIDLQKRREIALYQMAERDSLTGAYNRRTAERLITQILLSSGATQLHGFLTLDIDEFKQVNDTFGHTKGDYLLQQISSGIGETLRNEDILARVGGDEFVVFLNDFKSVFQIEKVAERLCRRIHKICIEPDNNYRPTISIGISIYLRDGSTFADLYSSSDKALYYVKRNGKNGFKLYSPKITE